MSPTYPLTSSNGAQLCRLFWFYLTRQRVKIPIKNYNGSKILVCSHQTGPNSSSENWKGLLKGILLLLWTHIL